MRTRSAVGALLVASAAVCGSSWLADIRTIVPAQIAAVLPAGHVCLETSTGLCLERADKPRLAPCAVVPSASKLRWRAEGSRLVLVGTSRCLDWAGLAWLRWLVPQRLVVRECARVVHRWESTTPLCGTGGACFGRRRLDAGIAHRVQSTELDAHVRAAPRGWLAAFAALACVLTLGAAGAAAASRGAGKLQLLTSAPRSVFGSASTQAAAAAHARTPGVGPTPPPPPPPPPPPLPPVQTPRVPFTPKLWSRPAPVQTSPESSRASSTPHRHSAVAGSKILKRKRVKKHHAPPPPAEPAPPASILPSFLVLKAPPPPKLGSQASGPSASGGAAKGESAPRTPVSGRSAAPFSPAKVGSAIREAIAMASPRRFAHLDDVRAAIMFAPSAGVSPSSSAESSADMSGDTSSDDEETDLANTVHAMSFKAELLEAVLDWSMRRGRSLPPKTFCRSCNELIVSAPPSSPRTVHIGCVGCHTVWHRQCLTRGRISRAAEFTCSDCIEG